MPLPTWVSIMGHIYILNFPKGLMTWGLGIPTAFNTRNNELPFLQTYKPVKKHSIYSKSAAWRRVTRKFAQFFYGRKIA